MGFEFPHFIREQVVWSSPVAFQMKCVCSGQGFLTAHFPFQTLSLSKPPH